MVTVTRGIASGSVKGESLRLTQHMPIHTPRTDVMNVSGHRLGSADFESALVAHADVSEAAVVAVPHDVKG